MALIAKTQFFAFLYKIKVDSTFGEVKKIYDAISASLAFVAVGIRNSSGPCFVAILG